MNHGRGDCMNNLKVGDRLTIHCYKHNGKLHRTWDEATILEENDEVLICGNNKTTVTESDGRSHKTNEPSVLYFYKKRWFNVIGQFKNQGLFYYCNIATPYLIDDNIIKYIDYDLDLRVFPDGGFRVLDRNEYNYHKKIMHYPDELDLILNTELSNLISMKKANIGPFDVQNINSYYEKYRNLKKIEKN
jgi:protein associated with RNAse G/E